MATDERDDDDETADRISNVLETSMVSYKMGEAVTWAHYIGCPAEMIREMFEECMKIVELTIDAARTNDPKMMSKSVVLKRMHEFFKPADSHLSVVPSDKDPA